MVRDLERLAAARGLGFRLPDPFPQNGLLAARLTTLGVRDGWVAPFARAVFTAEFAEGRDISDRTVLADLLEALGLDPDACLAATESAAVKQELRSATEAATAAGLFGAPSFVAADGELFWGDDRLVDALAWARSTSPCPDADSH
jgi:2-hydroxychromene-2-carboxylate isomerase